MSDELTSLGWLSSITTARNKRLTSQQTHFKITPSSSDTTGNKSSQKRNREKDLLGPTAAALKSMKEHRRRHRPPCSYSCLIAMALRASPTGCLPVHHIYRFIEQQYPFYRTAPEGWKNSVRHNLSMNQNFIKVLNPDEVERNGGSGSTNHYTAHVKKGFYWAINPDKMQSLELEIEKLLRLMGRGLIEDVNCSKITNFYGNETSNNEMLQDTSQLYCSPPVNSNKPVVSTVPAVAMTTKPATIDESTNNYTGQVVIKNDVNTALVLVSLLSMCAANKKIVPDHQTTNSITYNNDEPYKWIGEECIVMDTDDTMVTPSPIKAKKIKIIHDHMYCHTTTEGEVSPYHASSNNSSGVSSESSHSSLSYCDPKISTYQEDQINYNCTTDSIIGESITEHLMLSSPVVAEQCTINGELPFAQFELEN